MCDPKNTKQYEIYEGCGHQLPAKACDYYAYAHHKCYEAPDVAKNVNCYQWDDGKYYSGLCRFCNEGKDIERAWKYGLKWKDRENWM